MIMEKSTTTVEFKVTNLILTESSFNRVNMVNFDEDVIRNMDINVGVSITGNIVSVSETVLITHTFKEVEQVKILVTMIGVFEASNQLPEDEFESFGRINGAAIIFPYIREHITNLSVKGGLGAIVLPPVNFVQLAERQAHK